jgi:hypothetical protein
MKNKLEQIFWRNGKYVNSKGKEVEPKEIGDTHVVRLNYPFIEEEILKKSKKISLDTKIKNPSRINSYMICGGIEACYSFIGEPGLIYVSLGFYKI